MDTMSPYLAALIGFVVGAAAMGGWWWWINNRAKARAALQTVENVAKKL